MAQPTLVEELSTCFVTAKYFDQNGNPYTPINVNYKVDDLTNEINIIPWTPVVTPGLSNVITIPAANNAMTNSVNKIEKRQVTVQAIAPGGAQKYDPIVYDLLNIYGVPT